MNPLVVVGIYTKSGAKAARHEWTDSVTSVGSISYASLQVYASFGGPNFSSVACDQLDCATFLHLPAVNIIFSFASYAIQIQPLPRGTGSIVNLCQTSRAIFRQWQLQTSSIEDAVQALQAALRVKKKKNQNDVIAL